MTRLKTLDIAGISAELDRYDTEEPERLANEASYEARHAMNIAKSVRLVKDGTRNEEQLILHWEEPLKHLSGTLQIEPRLDDGYELLTGVTSRVPRITR